MDQNFSDNFTTNDDPFSIPNLNLWTWKTILHSFPYKVIPKWRFPNFPFASDLRPQGCPNGSCGSKTPHKQLSTAKKLTQILRLSLMAFFKNLEDANFNSMVRSKNCLLLFGSVPYETTGPISRISTTRQAKMGSPNGSSTLRGTGFSVLKNSALLKYGVNEYQQMWGVIYHRKSLTNINSIIESYHLIKKTEQTCCAALQSSSLTPSHAAML